MKKYIKLDNNFKQVLKIFFITFTICSLSLILVSMIPDRNIDNNIEKSLVKMTKQTVSPRIFNNNVAYNQIDNWTEASMLDFIYNCDSSKPLECAFAQRYYTINKSGLDNANALVQDTSPNINHEGKPTGENILRSSYWLGSRVIYMPLLVFKDYYFIRYIIVAIAVFLSVFTAIKLAEKINWKYAIAFACAILGTNYFVSLHVSCNAMMYILTFIGMDYILLSKRKVNYFNFMFIIGMLTIFFDWFSFPLITWGFITITILLKEYNQNKEIKFDQLFNIVFKTALAWCLGYAAMLIFRLLFSCLVAGKEALEYFIERVTTNTGANTSNGNNLRTAISFCLGGINPIFVSSFDNSIIKLIIFGIVTLGICIYLITQKKPLGLLLYVISFSPFAWIMVFNGFHAVHWWFAYRSLGIYLFATILIYIMFLVDIFTKINNAKITKKIIKKLKSANVVRFLIVGGISTLIDYFIYMIISLKISIVLAKCISMICACIFSFFVNKQWTFKSKESVNVKMVALFIMSQIINIGVNTGTNYLLYTLIKSRTIPFIIATGVAMVVNYLLQNYIVFKGGKK